MHCFRTRSTNNSCNSKTIISNCSESYVIGAIGSSDLFDLSNICEISILNCLRIYCQVDNIRSTSTTSKGVVQVPTISCFWKH